MRGKRMPHRSLRRAPLCAQRSPPQRKTLRGRNIFRGKGYNLHQTMRRRVKSLTALGALLLIATVHLMPEGFHIHIMETAGGGWHVTSIACPNESPLLAPGTTREIFPASSPRFQKGSFSLSRLSSPVPPSPPPLGRPSSSSPTEVKPHPPPYPHSDRPCVFDSPPGRTPRSVLRTTPLRRLRRERPFPQEEP